MRMTLPAGPQHNARVDNNITVRPAAPHELDVVAGLRWQWILENEGVPVTGRDEFVQYFTTWARQNTSSHRCMVLVRDEVLIAMAWLAVLQRVPSPRALQRASGDLQCVYVVPGERDSGLGGRLIDAVLTRAGELGLERVTVHSSPRAIPAYSRHGFEPSPVCSTLTSPAPPPVPDAVPDSRWPSAVRCFAALLRFAWVRARRQEPVPVSARVASDANRSTTTVAPQRPGRGR
jgi:GNAT superfamily N-acetyltransferase